MRNLLRLVQGLPTHPVMIALLRAPELLQATEVEGVDELCIRRGLDDEPVSARFAELKKLALGAMQLVDGSVLSEVTLIRITPKASLQIPSADKDHLVVVLNASTASRLMVGDEAPEVHAGEIWWLQPSQEARMINSNGADDDLVALLVDVRTDR